MNKYSRLFLTELVPFSREQQVSDKPASGKDMGYLEDTKLAVACMRSAVIDTKLKKDGVSYLHGLVAVDFKADSFGIAGTWPIAVAVINNSPITILGVTAPSKEKMDTIWKSLRRYAPHAGIFTRAYDENCKVEKILKADTLTFSWDIDNETGKPYQGNSIEGRSTVNVLFVYWETYKAILMSVEVIKFSMTGPNITYSTNNAAGFNFTFKRR